MTATQLVGAKQSSARIPIPPFGVALALTDCDDALYFQMRLPAGSTPPITHVVETHELEVSIDDGALGTTSEDQVPFDSRYSPTDVGGVEELVVPMAMHESDVVHALRWSGTEMPIEGMPVT